MTGISLIDLFANIFGIIMWIGIIYVIFYPVFKYFKKETILKLWRVGTTTPIQRIGLIVLIIGISSFASWLFKREIALEEIFNSYYFPKRRDFIFFHLYLYFIPIGLLMTWGYQILVKIKEWIFGNKLDKGISAGCDNIKNGNILYFKNNTSAFDFSLTVYTPNLIVGHVFFGIVISKNPHGSENMFFIIELANVGEKIIVTGINYKYYNLINVGDIIYWKLLEDFKEKRLSDIQATGCVLATLYPEFNPTTKTWAIKEDLTK